MTKWIKFLKIAQIFLGTSFIFLVSQIQSYWAINWNMFYCVFTLWKNTVPSWEEDWWCVYCTWSSDDPGAERGRTCGDREGGEGWRCWAQWQSPSRRSWSWLWWWWWLWLWGGGDKSEGSPQQYHCSIYSSPQTRFSRWTGWSFVGNQFTTSAPPYARYNGYHYHHHHHNQ